MNAHPNTDSDTDSENYSETDKENNEDTASDTDSDTDSNIDSDFDRIPNWIQTSEPYFVEARHGRRRALRLESPTWDYQGHDPGLELYRDPGRGPVRDPGLHLPAESQPLAF